MFLAFKKEVNLRSHLFPALPRQKFVKPLRDMGILLESAEITSISSHYSVWNVEEISKSQLISSDILLLRENSFINSQRGIECCRVFSEQGLIGSS